MAAVTYTADQVARIYSRQDEVFDMPSDITFDRGYCLFEDTDSKLSRSLAAAAGTAKISGMALNKGSQGMVAALLKRGFVAGFNVSSLNPGAKVFLADDGSFADAAGTVSVVVGTVRLLPDGTKALYVDFQWND